EDVGLHDRLAFLLVDDLDRHLHHARKHLTVFAEPDGELDQVPHRGWHGAGVDLEFPAMVSPHDLALWRSMRCVLSMADMGSNRTERGQGTAAEHGWSNDGSAQQPLPGSCRAGEDDPSDASEDEQTDDEQPGITPDNGVLVDAYGLTQASGRKRWSPRHRNNFQVKRVGAADRKEILHCQMTVC